MSNIQTASIYTTIPKNRKPMNRCIRCIHCKGSGYLKMTSVVCSSCKGKTCIQCNSTGLSVLPYETCVYCFGAGEI